TVSRTEESQADFEQGTLVGTKATANGLELDTGNQSGYRIAPALDLTPVRVVRSSRVEWDAIEPPGTSVTVETSVDGGNTWQPIANGEPIPGLHEGMAAEGVSVLWRQVLTSQHEV